MKTHSHEILALTGNSSLEKKLKGNLDFLRGHFEAHIFQPWILLSLLINTGSCYHMVENNSEKKLNNVVFDVTR